MTGKRLGSVFSNVAVFLGDKQEEAAKQAMIVWSHGDEAATLAAEDDAENELFRSEAKARLNRDQ